MSNTRKKLPETVKKNTASTLRNNLISAVERHKDMSRKNDDPLKKRWIEYIEKLKKKKNGTDDFEHEISELNLGVPSSTGILRALPAFMRPTSANRHAIQNAHRLALLHKTKQQLRKTRLARAAAAEKKNQTNATLRNALEAEQRAFAISEEGQAAAAAAAARIGQVHEASTRRAHEAALQRQQQFRNDPLTETDEGFASYGKYKEGTRRKGKGIHKRRRRRSTTKKKKKSKRRRKSRRR